ncbi:MAG: hypothetical protein ACK4NS_07760 [Saprospiraceae bacterium]
MRTWIYIVAAALWLPIGCKDKEGPEDWAPNFEGRFKGVYTAKGLTPSQNSVINNLDLQLSPGGTEPSAVDARFSVASFSFTLRGKVTSATRMDFGEQVYLGGMASGYLLLGNNNQSVEVQLKTSGVDHTEANFFGTRE